MPTLMPAKLTLGIFVPASFHKNADMRNNIEALKVVDTTHVWEVI